MPKAGGRRDGGLSGANPGGRRRPDAAAGRRRRSLDTAGRGRRQPLQSRRRSVVDAPDEVGRPDEAVGARRGRLVVTPSSGQTASWRRVDHSTWNCHHFTAQTSHRSEMRSTRRRVQYTVPVPFLSRIRHVRINSVSQVYIADAQFALTATGDRPHKSTTVTFSERNAHTCAAARTGLPPFIYCTCHCSGATPYVVQVSRRSPAVNTPPTQWSEVGPQACS